MSGLKLTETEQRFRQLLIDQDIDPNRPPMIETWNVFKDFCALEVDSASDGVLFQAFMYEDASGSRQFIVDFVRQFEVLLMDNERYEHLHCEFRFDPTSAPAAEGPYSQWWFPETGETLADFFVEVGKTPQLLVACRTPWVEARVAQEKV